MSEADRALEEAGLVAKHEQLKSELDAAVEAYKADPSPENKDRRKAAMEAMANERKYWREVGEVTGHRSGVVKTEDGV